MQQLVPLCCTLSSVRSTSPTTCCRFTGASCTQTSVLITKRPAELLHSFNWPYTGPFCRIDITGWMAQTFVAAMPTTPVDLDAEVLLIVLSCIERPDGVKNCWHYFTRVVTGFCWMSFVILFLHFWAHSRVVPDLQYSTHNAHLQTARRYVTMLRRLPGYGVENCVSIRVYSFSLKKIGLQLVPDGLLLVEFINVFMWPFLQIEVKWKLWFSHGHNSTGTGLQCVTVISVKNELLYLKYPIGRTNYQYHNMCAFTIASPCTMCSNLSVKFEPIKVFHIIRMWTKWKTEKEWLCDWLPNDDSTDDIMGTLLCLQFPKIAPKTFMYTTELWKSMLVDLTKGTDTEQNGVTFHILPALLTFTLEPPPSWFTYVHTRPPPLSYSRGPPQSISLFKWPPHWDTSYTEWNGQNLNRDLKESSAVEDLRWWVQYCTRYSWHILRHTQLYVTEGMAGGWMGFISHTLVQPVIIDTHQWVWDAS